MILCRRLRTFSLVTRSSFDPRLPIDRTQIFGEWTALLIFVTSCQFAFHIPMGQLPRTRFFQSSSDPSVKPLDSLPKPSPLSQIGYDESPEHSTLERVTWKSLWPPRPP